MPANALRVIFPYKDHGIWVFDDATVGLVKEPFVSGVPEIIERLVKAIPNPENGFTLLLSDTPFPRYQAELVWVRQEFDGNWYRLEGTNMEGWLCAALSLYFATPPPRLYLATAPRVAVPS